MISSRLVVHVMYMLVYLVCDPLVVCEGKLFRVILHVLESPLVRFKELENAFMQIHLLAHEAIVGLVDSLCARNPWRLEPRQVPARHDARISSGRLIYGNGVIREVILQNNNTKHKSQNNTIVCQHLK